MLEYDCDEPDDNTPERLMVKRFGEPRIQFLGKIEMSGATKLNSAVARFSVATSAPRDAFTDGEKCALSDERVGALLDEYMADIRGARSLGLPLDKFVLGGLADDEGISYVPHTDEPERAALKVALSKAEAMFTAKFGSCQVGRLTLADEEQEAALQSATGKPYGRGY